MPLQIIKSTAIEIIDEIEAGIKEEIDHGDFKITIEEGDDKIEIKASARRKELIDKLEELEEVKGVDITIKVDTSKEE